MTTILFLMLACSTTPHEHGDHDHDHGDGTHTHAEEKPAAAPSADSEAIEAQVAGHTLRVEPSAKTLKITVVDGEGKPVAASGEARVLLTGTGDKPQRIMLQPDGDAWTGPAIAAGADGYVAVIKLKIGGIDQATRVTWGDVPEAAPPTPAPAHDHGAEGHGHDHGPGGHSH